MRPASILLFERLWIAALLLGGVAMAAGWAPTLAAYRASGVFTGLGMDARTGLALIDGSSLLLQVVVLVLVARAGSRIAVVMAFLLALWALVTVGRLLGQDGGVPGTQGMLAVICILLQVAGAMTLLRPDARAWFKGRKA